MNTAKKIISVLAVLCMLLCFVPASFAEDGGDEISGTYSGAWLAQDIPVHMDVRIDPPNEGMSWPSSLHVGTACENAELELRDGVYRMYLVIPDVLYDGDGIEVYHRVTDRTSYIDAYGLEHYIRYKDGYITYERFGSDATILSFIVTPGVGEYTLRSGGYMKALIVNFDSDVYFELSFDWGDVDSAGFHTPAEPVSENVREATCVEAGGYDSVVYCSWCGIELDRTAVQTDAAKGHADADDDGWCDVCSAELAPHDENSGEDGSTGGSSSFFSNILRNIIQALQKLIDFLRGLFG